MSNKIEDLYDGISCPLFGKHFNGSVHAVFGTQFAALAWQRGLSAADKQLFRLEDADGNAVVMEQNAHGHAYAVMAKLAEHDRKLGQSDA